ncbi:MAG: glycosyltransferase family 39 protein [Bryobacteraceae bacterium]
MEGQIPFRDFFEVMGPGTFYWLALFFKILGVTWLATRICLLFTTLGMVVLLYYLTRRLRCGMAAIPAIFFVAVSYHNWNAISHHNDSTLLALAAFAAYVFSTQTGNRSFLFLAGLTAGLTTCFMLPKGLLLCLSFGLLTLLLNRPGQRLRGLLILASGYLLVLSATATYFWHARALSDLVYANVVWPFTSYHGVNTVPYGLEFRELYWNSFISSFSAVVSPFVATLISSWLSLPFLIAMGLPALLLTLCISQGRTAFDRTTLPYWLSGAALWLSEMHRKDLGHIVFGSPLLIILAVYLCSRAAQKWPVRAAVRVAFLSACTLAALNPLVALTASHTLPTRRGLVRDTSKNNPVLAFLNEHVKPGDSIFVYPYAPLYYFLSATHNPTRYSILMYNINTDAQFTDAIRALDTNQVRYIVWDRSFPMWINKWFPAYRIPDAAKQTMESHILGHYTLVTETQNGYQILQRSTPAKPIIADLRPKEAALQ